MMAIDDAVNIVSWATEDPDGVNTRALVAAADALRRRMGELEKELERERARARSPSRHAGPQMRRVEGHTLIEGTDGGGKRHFLSGTAVHAGTGLCLLTHIGWYPGRYEWNFRPGSPGGFYFSLPGVGPELSIPILSEARLAWPAEIEG